METLSKLETVKTFFDKSKSAVSFDAIRIRIASSEKNRTWS